MLFEPGNPADLAEKMALRQGSGQAWAQAHQDSMLAVGEAARREYEAKYTPEVNYRQLLAIYEEAVGIRSAQ